MPPPKLHAPLAVCLAPKLHAPLAVCLADGPAGTTLAEGDAAAAWGQLASVKMKSWAWSRRAASSEVVPVALAQLHSPSAVPKDPLEQQEIWAP